MKTVIITGTSSGIGLDLVKTFDLNGYYVISLSRNDLPITTSYSENVNHINFDITNNDDINSLIELLKSKYTNIDILINNAGKLISKPFSDFSHSEFKSIYDVNLFGVVNLIKSLLPFFHENSHIVNISSVGGINGSSKFPGLSSYSSSKGALNILTEVLAVEFENGPYINSLCLGAVQTPMLELAFPDYKALTKPKDMANFIYSFSTSNPIMFNGKIIPVSISNP
jgi:NAD(P)-dependent dehydrogenase (short-subunit alcohol dehydrogenase family)